MPRLYHPTLQRRYVDVTEEQAEEHRKMGWRDEPKMPTTAGTEPATVGESVEQPAGNASHEDWVEYAVFRGMDRERANELTRDQLRDGYSE